MPFKEGATSRREISCSRSIPGPTRPSSTRPKGRSTSTRPSSSWPRSPTIGTSPSTTGCPTRSASKSSTSARPRSRRPRPGSSPIRKAWRFYRLDHEFTKVISPIDGQISRYYLTLGNLVTQDQTLLTTVVSLDPMYAYFDIDEPTLLRIRKAINEGRIKRHPQGTEIPVLMGLQGEDGYPHQGTINFVNNQVDPTTGSILARGVFPNPEPAGGRPAAVARDVRADPPADRPAPPRAPGHRPRRGVRPGAEVRLRARCREQGPVPPGHDRGPAGRTACA